MLLAAARAAVCVQDERLAVTLCCGCPRDTVPLGCGAAPVQASSGRGTFQLSFVPVPPAPGVCWGTAGIFPEPAARGISHFHAVSPRGVRDLHVHWHDLRSTMCGRHQGCPSCRVTVLFLLALSNPVCGHWVLMQRKRKNWGRMCWVLPQVLELSYFPLLFVALPAVYSLPILQGSAVIAALIKPFPGNLWVKVCETDRKGQGGWLGEPFWKEPRVELPWGAAPRVCSVGA